MLQISRFPWGDDPAAWLAAVAEAAAEAGFDGLALMDHLIQIPQVGRAWEPIPEPWVTLGLLAGLPHRAAAGHAGHAGDLPRAGVLAKTVATLDVLTGGRAFCGVGAGWWDREHAAFGLPFPPARTGSTSWSGDRDACARCGAPGTKAVPRRAGVAAGDHLLPAAGRCRSRSSSAARGARSCASRPGSATAATCRRISIR